MTIVTKLIAIPIIKESGINSNFTECSPSGKKTPLTKQFALKISDSTSSIYTFHPG